MVNDPVIDILLIEDEMNSQLLSDRLKREFHEKVNILRNGHTLSKDLEMYRDRDIDVIIVDEQYTGMDATEAIKAIKKKKPDAEVIVLSSHTEKSLAEKVRTAGAFDFVYKDKSAIDKVIYAIRGMRINKNLRRENNTLKSTKKKSGALVAVLIVLFIAAVAAAIYFLTK